MAGKAAFLHLAQAAGKIFQFLDEGSGLGGGSLIAVATGLG